MQGMAAPLIAETKATAKKRGRNAFVRTAVPTAERVSGIVIVILLLGIGVAIAIKGQHFNPDLYSLRTDALDSTKSAVEGKEGTLRQKNGTQAGEEGDAKTAAPAKTTAAVPAADEGYPEGGDSAAAPKPAAKGEPLEINLDGTKPMGATEFYNSDNLFEKIDGRSPAYQSFNVEQLRSRSFAVAGADGSYVDVYEYRMDTPVNAFGIFALERDPKGKPLDFAKDGYSGEMGYFFRQGNVYVQIIASDQNAKTMELAKAIAENRAKVLPADDAGLDATRKLPAVGLIPGSITYVQENAQGQASLKNVFQAAYDFEGKKLSFFLMVAPPKEAAAAWQAYRDFSARFGKVEPLPDVKGGKIFRAESFGKWRAVYQRDGEIGGVYDADDGEKARQFVEKYLQEEIK
jgi:hypothetical protein